VVVGDFNAPIFLKEWSFRQKIKLEILKLNGTMDLMYLKEIHRVVHHAIAKYTFFSAAHGTLRK
jgi:hypothetical protein